MNCHLQAPTSVKGRNTSEHEDECTKRSTLRRVTYKEGPHVRANGGTKVNALRDLDKGPQIRLSEVDKDELLPGGVGRPSRSVEPGQHPIQMHFDVA